MNDCLPTVDFANLISACLLRLRMKSPFFGTLVMFARFLPSQTVPYAATDGRDVFVNPEFLASLPKEQQDGIILHEILHAALLHSLRLNEREPELWNIAADIVVNGTISRQIGIELPPGGLRDEQLEHLSVEEVYELLRETDTSRFKLADLDILPMKAGDAGESHPVRGLEQKERELLAAHWRQAIQQATAVARTTQWGKLSIGSEREFEMVVNPQLDWKAQLWRFLVRTPTDFLNFDRRFVGRGLYLEALQGESVKVYLAIDTSGSIGSETLRLFMGELDGILGSYPHLECDLYYVDTELYGPYRLNVDTPIPPPEGGGGTSFVPFFDRVAATYDEHTQAVCIYLTDGFGEFPPAMSVLPTLWVVTPGGLDIAQFPFGEAIRLV